MSPQDKAAIQESWKEGTHKLYEAVGKATTAHDFLLMFITLSLGCLMALIAPTPQDAHHFALLYGMVALVAVVIYLTLNSVSDWVDTYAPPIFWLSLWVSAALWLLRLAEDQMHAVSLGIFCGCLVASTLLLVKFRRLLEYMRQVYLGPLKDIVGTLKVVGNGLARNYILLAVPSGRFLESEAIVPMPENVFPTSAADHVLVRCFEMCRPNRRPLESFKNEPSPL